MSILKNVTYTEKACLGFSKYVGFLQIGPLAAELRPSEVDPDPPKVVPDLPQKSQKTISRAPAPLGILEFLKPPSSATGPDTQNRAKPS